VITYRSLSPQGKGLLLLTEILIIQYGTFENEVRYQIVSTHLILVSYTVEVHKYICILKCSSTIRIE